MGLLSWIVGNCTCGWKSDTSFACFRRLLIQWHCRVWVLFSGVVKSFSWVLVRCIYFSCFSRPTPTIDFFSFLPHLSLCFPPFSFQFLKIRQFWSHCHLCLVHIYLTEQLLFFQLPLSLFCSCLCSWLLAISVAIHFCQFFPSRIAYAANACCSVPLLCCSGDERILWQCYCMHQISMILCHSGERASPPYRVDARLLNCRTSCAYKFKSDLLSTRSMSSHLITKLLESRHDCSSGKADLRSEVGSHKILLSFVANFYFQKSMR